MPVRQKLKGRDLEIDARSDFTIVGHCRGSVVRRQIHGQE
jgi:hypothetical protein